jgi:putative metal-binding protein
MKKLLPAILVFLGLVSAPARATCDSGFTIYLAGQLPDVTFTTQVPQTVHFNPWYVSFLSNDGSCGIFARSTLPGVSIRQTYGCPGACPLLPAGQWAAVGDAYPGLSLQVSHKSTDIPIEYNGTTPAGSHGVIEIGVRDNDLGIATQRIIGTVNVYVESTAPPVTWFGASSTSANISGDRVYLDHPYLNAKPNANVFLSHIRNLGGSIFGSSWNHPIAVEYDGALERWTIRNMDATTMPAGLGFGVRIDPTGELYCTSSFPSTYSEILVLHPDADRNPYATILVTPISGSGHPVSVKYSAPYWRIVHTDGAAISPSTCFNVKVFAFTQYLDDPASGDLSGFANVTADWGTGVDAGGSGTGHTSGSSRVLQFDWALEGPFRQMMMTYNQTPMGFAPYLDARYFGFSVPGRTSSGGRWSVYHEDGTTMPLAARFNVWAPCAGSAWYPDADGDGYGVSGEAQASCAALPGYAPRSGDCDDADVTRYPGSPEINDGRDNQCPGEPGYGQIDEIAALLFYDPVSLCWSPQIGATEYALARSSVGSFSSCSHVSFPTSTCDVVTETPSAGQVYFYLVRAWSPWAGSWGTNSSGQERQLDCS